MTKQVFVVENLLFYFFAENKSKKVINQVKEKKSTGKSLKKLKLKLRKNQKKTQIIDYQCFNIFNLAIKYTYF